jgi:hypothetical protein
MWVVAGACFVALVGAVIFREAREAATCTGAPRVAADVFTRTLVTEGRVAAADRVASFAQFLVPQLPTLRPARPADVRQIVATGRRNGPGCSLFTVTRPLPAGNPGPCFGYDLPSRVTGTDGYAIAFTVACENREWRVNAFR